MKGQSGNTALLARSGQPFRQLTGGIRGPLAGYTLLELMITLVVLGILASLTVPGFQDTIRRNARDSSMSNLGTALGFARAQAVTEATPVSICRSTNLTACAGTTGADWRDGWIIFTDRGTAGTVDGDDRLLQAREAMEHDWVIRLLNGSGASISGEFLSYDSNGFLDNSASGAYFRFCNTDKVQADARALLILRTGRTTPSRDDGDGIHNDLSGANLVCP